LLKAQLFKAALWHMSVMPALQRLRQEDCKYGASLGYIGRHGLIKTKSKSKSTNQTKDQMFKSDMRLDGAIYESGLLPSHGRAHDNPKVST
jgi:hypothetical protein